MQKIAIGLITLLIFVLAVSGCTFFNNIPALNTSDVTNYIEKTEGINIDHIIWKENSSADGKTTSTEVLFNTTSGKVQKWNGTWSYNGTAWNPNPDFKRTE